MLPAVHGAPRSQHRTPSQCSAATAERRRDGAGSPAVLSATVRVAEQYARDTLPSTEAANCGNALADHLNMAQHSGTHAGHERSHTFYNELSVAPEEYPVLPKSARSQPSRLPRLGGLAKRGQLSAEGELRRPSQERDGDESRCRHRVDPGGSERGLHAGLFPHEVFSFMTPSAPFEKSK